MARLLQQKLSESCFMFYQKIVGVLLIRQSLGRQTESFARKTNTARTFDRKYTDAGLPFVLAGRAY